MERAGRRRHSTTVSLLSFAPKDAKRFSSLCNSHSATVTSALYELAVCVPAHDIVRYKTLSVIFPVSLRQLTGAHADEVRNYVSSHAAFPALHTEFSWPCATRLAGKLQVTRKKSRERLGLLKSRVAPGAITRG